MTCAGDRVCDDSRSYRSPSWTAGGAFHREGGVDPGRSVLIPLARSARGRGQGAPLVLTSIVRRTMEPMQDRLTVHGSDILATVSSHGSSEAVPVERRESRKTAGLALADAR